MDTIQNYQCPCCGASLSFSADSQNLHCDSCGNDFDVTTMQQLLEGQAAASEPSKFDWSEYTPRSFEAADSESLASYTCPSCAAEITGDETLGSTTCPFCGNATIIKGTFEGALMPDYIIPFKVDKKAAVAKFEEAYKKAPFLPDEFKNKSKIDEMSGVYVPFWTFDCDCQAAINYSAQRVTTWSDSNYNYTKTDYFKLYRQGSVGFANIPVDGSEKADNAYMEALEPFDYKDAVNFNSGYLSGFLADKYDVSAEDSIDRANERVKVSTERAFMETTGMYTAVLPEQTNVNFTNGKIRYALLPVWMLNIKYLDKMYKFAINGQTGKVVGEYPVCKKKKWLYFAKVWGISLAVAALAAWIYHIM